jgi:hypothetical protein
MFSLTTFLQDSDGAPSSGVMSVYTTEGLLVARESSVDGVIRADIPIQGEYVFRVTNPSRTFLTRTLVIGADGEGEITLTALPVPTRTAMGADWCGVYGQFLTNIGAPAKVCFSAVLTSGDYKAEAAVVSNHPASSVTDDSGHIYLQLLRGRKYELTFGEVPLDYPETYEIHVPDVENASIYDILYPYAVAGFIDQLFTGDGDYTLTLLLSDGRTLTSDADVRRYIYSVEADNAEVEVITSESRAVLRVSGEPGAVVRIRGNRRGDLSTGPTDTLNLPGDVFLTLVS